MKRIKTELYGTVTVYNIPGNCQNPCIAAADACKAPHHSHPDCDCRWCVHNKEYNSLNQAEAMNDEEDE